MIQFKKLGGIEMDKSSTVVFITGCSSGFGKKISLALAEQGYQVIATMRDLTKQDALLSEAKKRNVVNRLEILLLDVTDEDSISQAVQQTLLTYGKIDILINNAGYAQGGFTEITPLSLWRKQFETNLFGTISVTQAVLPSMRKRKEGLIINMSSISGQFGFPALGPYVASKYAVEGFTESLRLEMLAFGVKVVLVEPGSFQTDIWKKSIVDSEMLPSNNVYRKAMTNMRKIAEHNSSSSGDPNQVIEMISRIIHTSAPTLRYPVGKGVRSLLFMKRLLPWRWVERLASKQITRFMDEDS